MASGTEGQSQEKRNLRQEKGVSKHHILKTFGFLIAAMAYVALAQKKREIDDFYHTVL